MQIHGGEEHVQRHKRWKGTTCFGKAMKLHVAKIPELRYEKAWEKMGPHVKSPLKMDSFPGFSFY